MKRALLILIVFLCLFLFLSDGRLRSEAQSSDPTASGPFTVMREEYDFGDTAFTPTGFPSAVELRGSVHYPTNSTGGPLPFILFLHGRHAVCFQGTMGGAFTWPCPAPQLPIPSYTGYDYIAQTIASNGYIVVSISANGINAFDNMTADLGAIARAELVQEHLDLWNAFNTVGGAPFGSKFIGKIDMQRVGLMGHSRGGEGVVRNFLLNQSLGSPYGIKAVFALAPVDFSRFVINNVALAVLLPYCDGDVSDLQGVHFYDDARYNVAGDAAPKHTMLVLGANHNFYNTIWTPSIFPAAAGDDWTGMLRDSDPHCGTVPGNGRLTDALQRATGLAYIAAFLRVYVGGESQFLSLLTAAAPPPPSAGSDKIYVSYHAPDNPLLRRDVNRLLDATNLVTSTIGGAVTPSGLVPYDVCGGPAPQTSPCLAQIDQRQPHTTPSLLSPAPGLSQLITGWNAATGSLIHDIPVGQRNVSGYEALLFRASVNFDDARNVAGAAQDFRVLLTDGAGSTASVRVSDLSRALFYPPGAVSSVPKVVLNTVRLPLLAFAGVNFTDIRSIEFRFDQVAQGALLITDIAFASGPTGAVFPPLFTICLKDDSSRAELLFNFATGDYIFCCGDRIFTGKGVVRRQGTTVTLVANEITRRINAKVELSARRGTASLQSPPGMTICTIIDRNIADNICSCGQ